jgi:ribose transport system ATP-binding protein
MFTLADRILVMRDFAPVGEIKNNRQYEPMSWQIMDLIHTGEDASENDARKDTAHG